jgi:hypothetical protein
MADKEKAPEKGRKPAKPARAQGTGSAPLLVEFTITASAVFLVMTFFTVLGISWLTGASLVALVLRTVVSLSVVGGLLLLLVRQVSAGVSSTEGKPEAQSQAQPESALVPQEAETPAAPEVK